jgi:hypothetical protein
MMAFALYSYDSEFALTHRSPFPSLQRLFNFSNIQASVAVTEIVLDVIGEVSSSPGQVTLNL